MNGIYLGLKQLINFVVEPLELILEDFGFDIPITMGIGQVEWFTINLDQIIIMIFVFITWFIFIRAFYSLLKMFWNLITRGWLT